MATKIISQRVSDLDIEGTTNDKDFAASLGWTAEIPDPDNQGQTIPNPELQEDFINRIITKYYLDNVNSFRISQARSEALQNVIIATAPTL